MLSSYITPSDDNAVNELYNNLLGSDESIRIRQPDTYRFATSLWLFLLRRHNNTGNGPGIIILKRQENYEKYIIS